MTHASVAGTDLEVPGRPDPAVRRHRDGRRPARRPRPGPAPVEPRAAPRPARARVEPSDRSSPAWTSARRSPRPRWSTSPTGALLAPPRATAPRSTPTCSTAGTPAWPCWPRPTRGPRTPRCWPARRPAAGCGSRSSATRRWSPPRPAAGSRCPAAAGSCTSPPAASTRDGLRGAAGHASPTWCCWSAAPTAATPRCCWPARRRWPRPAGAGRSWSPATSTRRPRSPRCSTAAGTPYVLADNVVPQIGVLAPGSARAAIREMFLRHVIGGKHLSQRADFTAMVRGATPDVVLTAVELLARGLDAEHPGAGDVVVVDVGGATTDVHSVVERRPRGRRARPRGGRHRAGQPHRRGRPRHAVERGVDGRGGRRRRPARRHPSAPRRPPRYARADPAVPAAGDDGDRARRRGRSRPRRSASRCAGTRAGRRSRSTPAAGSSSAAARTCARSTCSSGSGGVLRSTDARRRRPGARLRSPATTAGGWQLPRAPAGGRRPRLRARAGRPARRASTRDAAHALLARLR